MWRETDSWFYIQFEDGTYGYVHLNTDGDNIGLYTEDGTLIPDDVAVQYTCINDNAPPPPWYTP
jgi:hypothetical protein